MSEAKQAMIDKTEKLEKGLFLMSIDRERALSYHETEDLIEELRGTVAELNAELNKL